ncbi:MAG: hypothetical protein EOP05_01080 [Proteobacteria bacterium]|nr:MAG: hypothetical protein EOP05_01080 [Pseudomonadota bacterium]
MEPEKITESNDLPKKKLKEKPVEVAKASPSIKKLDPEAAKLLLTLREKANKKLFGRKVRESEIILLALKLVKSDHIDELQEATYSEKDRLEMVHAQYQKENGKITLDAFIGKLMRGEVKLPKANL